MWQVIWQLTTIAILVEKANDSGFKVSAIMQKRQKRSYFYKIFGSMHHLGRA
jgi:hypothetical protein